MSVRPGIAVTPVKQEVEKRTEKQQQVRKNAEQMGAMLAEEEKGHDQQKADDRDPAREPAPDFSLHVAVSFHLKNNPIQARENRSTLFPM